MSESRVCRICLRTEAKMYCFDRYQLKSYYEDIMGIKVTDKDGLPQYFCYECAALLHKFHKFREKCYSGLKVLKEILQNGSITRQSIANINRETTKLKSAIDILLVNKRVKTYLIKNKPIHNSLAANSHKKEFLDNIPKIKTSELPVIEVVRILYDSDDSLDNKNLAEYKNEIVVKEKTNIDTKNNDNEEMLEINTHDDEDMDFDVDRLSDSEKSDFENIVKGSNDCKMEKVVNTAITKNNKKRNVNKINMNKENTQGKIKKFEVTTKNELDPQNWLKINLSEEEALEDFKARAQDQKYLSASYKCYECYKGFSKEDMLNRHKKLRHNESVGPIECRFCHMRFKLKCFLTRHLTQHYTKYKCLRCELMCPLKSTAIFHNDYHNGVIRKCIHCGEEFRHLSTYYTHLRTHRSEHVCTLCGASFVSDVGLRQHRRTMHVNATVDPGEDVMHCVRCDIKFETRKAYEEHVFHSAKHFEGIEDISDIPAPPKSDKKRRRAIRRHPRKLTSCDICKKNFSTHTAYMKHHSTEHANMPIPSKDTERHICEICGLSLAIGSVASHLNTHTRSKLYACSMCGMQFNTKSSMLRHQLTHTGEKPYGCTLCDKRFTQRGSMKLHYRTFHLKEAYPKRNRKKKLMNSLETPIVEGYHINENLKIDRWR